MTTFYYTHPFLCGFLCGLITLILTISLFLLIAVIVGLIGSSHNIKKLQQDRKNQFNNIKG